jgi:YVTN family beta-propeller protein
MYLSSRRGLTALSVLVVLLLVVLGQRAIAQWLKRSHVIVATVTVGLDADAVAVDEQTGHVFVSNSSDGTVSMLDAVSGAVIHTTVVGGVPNQVAVDARTGRAFVLNDATNAVSVLDTTTGGVLRTLHPGVVHNLAMDEALGRVYVVGRLPDDASALYVLDAQSGSIRRAISTPLESWDTATVPGGRVLVTNRGDGSVSLIDPAAAHTLRTLPLGIHPTAVAVDAADGRAFVVDNGDRALANGGTVSILDTGDGRVVRTLHVGQDPAEVAVDARTSRIFVVYGRGGGKALTSGILPGGTEVFDERSGRLLHAVAVGDVPVDDVGSAVYPHMVAVDEVRGHVFIIDRSRLDRSGDPVAGSVSVLDAATGQILDTIPVDWAPVALALDETTGRLFVVNKDGRGPAGYAQESWAWVPSWLRPWLPLPPAPRPPGNNSTVTIVDTSRIASP